MDAPRIELERLLENARWVRALGVELVGAGEADDLAQEAWVVALEEQRGVRNPGAWLAGVVRHLAGRARRSAERRTRREQAVARPEAGPAADELVAEAELSRALIRAVTELDEPFRTTVLLRFYRGWTPEEIARSQDVPAATVRTRLHRALGKLRERLDREHGGREAWALAFTGPGALAARTIEGGMLLGTKTIVGTAAALTLAAGALWWGRDEGARDSVRIEARVAADGGPPAERQAPPEARAEAEPGERREPVPAAASRVVDEVLLYGAVHEERGDAVALESLALEDAQGAVRSVSRPVAGSYSLAGLAPGPYTLRARAKGFVSRREELVLRRDEEHQRHDLVLAPGLAIPVRIVDETGALWKEDGDDFRKGRLDVVVTASEPREVLCGLRREPGTLYGSGEYVVAGDDEARLVPPGCSGLVRTTAPAPLFVSLVLRDATLATRRVDGPTAELVFTLNHAQVEGLRGGVSARFVDALTGRAVTGGQAGLDPPATHSGGGPDQDELGAVRIDGVAPGLHRLRFFHPDYADTGRTVRVPVGRVEELGDVVVWPKATIRGTVLDDEGRAVNANVRALPPSDLGGPADLVVGSTWHAAGGRLTLESVPRGLVRLIVHAKDHAPLVRTIDASSGLVEDLVLRLEEGTRVVLRAPVAWRGRQVTLADEAGLPVVTWTLVDASLRTQLAPGRYQLWIGYAERVDERRELVVGSTPVDVDLGAFVR